MAPGTIALIDVTMSGARAVDIASASLASSTRFIELDAAVWSNNTVRVMARNRTQRGSIQQTAEGEFEGCVVTQVVSVVGVLVAGSDHQQAEAQHVGKAVADALGRARIVDARGETSGHAEPVLDLTQRQKAAIG